MSSSQESTFGKVLYARLAWLFVQTEELKKGQLIPLTVQPRIADTVSWEVGYRGDAAQKPVSL